MTAGKIRTEYLSKKRGRNCIENYATPQKKSRVLPNVPRVLPQALLAKSTSERPEPHGVQADVTFDAAVQPSDSDAAPQPCAFDPQCSSAVRAFQRALQTVSDDQLPIERRSEADAVRDFLQSRIDGGSGGSLFVAGKPGTGKTLTVQAVTKAVVRQQARVQPVLLPPIAVSLNCANLAGGAQDAFGRLLAAIQGNCARSAAEAVREPLIIASLSAPTRDALLQLQDFTADSVAQARTATGSSERSITCHGRQQSAPAAIHGIPATAAGRPNTIIVILDEVDMLLSNPQVLTDLVKLAGQKRSKLAIVGISNTYDLTLRHLPLLSAAKVEAPQQLLFAPYTQTQLTAVLRQRLAPHYSDAVSPLALRMTATRVAANNGDMRLALAAISTAARIMARNPAEYSPPEGKAWQVDPAAVSAAIAQQSCTLSHTAVATVSDHHQLILVALCNLTDDDNSRKTIEGWGLKGRPEAAEPPKVKLPAWAVMPKARVKAAFKGQQGCTLKAVHARYAQLCAQVGTTVYEAYPLNVVRSMLDVMDKCVRYRGPSKYREATLELIIGSDDVRRGLAGKPVFLRLLGGPAARLLTGEPQQQHNR